MITQEYKIPIIVSNDAIQKIKYMNTRISRNEWVGIALYYKEGSLEQDNLVIELIDVYPNSKAHGMRFNTEYASKVSLYILENGYDLAKIHQGLIHSHCEDSVYFSNPDISELKDNSKAHNDYLSVITNNNLDFTAKYVTHGVSKIESKIWNQNRFSKIFNGNYAIKIKEEDIYYVNECIVSYEDNTKLPSNFLNRVEEIIKKSSTSEVVSGSKQLSFKNAFSPFDFSNDYEEDLTEFLLNVCDSDVDYSLDSIVKILTYESSIYGPKSFLNTYDDMDLLKQVPEILKPFNTTFSNAMVKDYENYIKLKKV